MLSQSVSNWLGTPFTVGYGFMLDSSLSSSSCPIIARSVVRVTEAGSQGGSATEVTVAPLVSNAVCNTYSSHVPIPKSTASAAAG